MPRYVAFLRGISPLNAKMSELKSCFEAAGFTDVATVLGTGNVVLSSKLKSEAQVERKAEAAMMKHLGRTFYTIVRSADSLAQLVESDPFAAFDVPAEAKLIVTFLRETRKPAVALPLELDGARVHAIRGAEVFTSYIANPNGPVFMKLIAKAFGSEVTTRTWDTVKKCVKACGSINGPAKSGGSHR